MNEVEAMKKYNFLGSEEYEGVCDFCGKKHITTAYVVEDENGNVFRFGSSCIKKALNINAKTLSVIYKTAIDTIKKDFLAKTDTIQEKMTKLMKEYRVKNNYNLGMLPETEVEYWTLDREYNEIYKDMYNELKKYVS